MTDRTIRVGELLLHELSLVLHSKWRSESVGITLTSVEVSEDLRSARVFYSAIGDRQAQANAGRFLAKNKKELKRLMMQKITLKYTPDLQFVYDYSFERGSRVMDIIEELEREENDKISSKNEQKNAKNGQILSENDDFSDEPHSKNAEKGRTKNPKKSQKYDRNKLKNQDKDFEY